MRYALIALVAWAVVVPAAQAASTIQPGDPFDVNDCTLSWVFDAPDGDVFFTTAAHCVTDREKVTTGPAVVGGPYSGFVFAANEEVLGTVRARGDENDVDSDVALIQVSDAMKSRVRPEMRGHPDIPTGIAREGDVAVGDLVQFSGYGLATSATATTREQRQGVFVGETHSGAAWEAAWADSPGDSGGPIAVAGTGAALGSFKGDQSGYGWGPTIAGVEKLGASIGLTLRLRRAGESAPAPAPPTAAAGQGPGSTATSTAPPARSADTHVASGPSSEACADHLRPALRVASSRARRAGLRLAGTATDAGCGGRVARVEVAVGSRRFVRARGTDRWSFALRAHLPQGRCRVKVRVTDAAGNRTELRRTLRVR